jgi:HEPN domain-containing protein
MTDIKQADAMLRMASRDLTALHGMQNAAVFADEIFGFHVQQTVEKSLKAWMCAIGLTYPFTHQINRLLVLLRNAGADVEAFWWTDMSSPSMRIRLVVKRGIRMRMRHWGEQIFCESSTSCMSS